MGSGRPRKFGWLDVDETMRIGPYEIRRLVGGRPIYDEGVSHTLPDPIPLVAKSYGTSPWPEVSLEFLNGPSRSAVWPMNRVMSLVGSAAGCKFRLADPSVSPFHCSLLRTSVGLWIVDLLGSDGVAVNNASVRYALLTDGDLVKIGRYRIRVRSRFFDDHLHPDHPSASLPPPQRPQSRALSVREAASSLAAQTPSDLGETPASGKPPWSVSTTLAPLSFGSQIARTELLPSAGTGFYPPGSEKAEVEASVLVPLVNQFGMMQQQMLDQFQNAMGMLVEMFGTLQREQMDQIRQELDQLREVTREFQDVKLELAAYKKAQAQAEAAAANTAAASPPPSPRPQEVRPPAVAPTHHAASADSASTRTAPPSESRAETSRTEGAVAAKKTPNPIPGSPAGGVGKRPGEGAGGEKERDVMLWLNQRIVTLQEERETRWQKILKLLPGAS